MRTGAGYGRWSTSSRSPSTTCSRRLVRPFHVRCTAATSAGSVSGRGPPRRPASLDVVGSARVAEIGRPPRRRHRTLRWSASSPDGRPPVTDRTASVDLLDRHSTSVIPTTYRWMREHEPVFRTSTDLCLTPWSTCATYPPTRPFVSSQGYRRALAGETSMTAKTTPPTPSSAARAERLRPGPWPRWRRRARDRGGRVAMAC